MLVVAISNRFLSLFRRRLRISDALVGGDILAKRYCPSIVEGGLIGSDLPWPWRCFFFLRCCMLFVAAGLDEGAESFCVHLTLSLCPLWTQIHGLFPKSLKSLA